jgi:hypothetical protein
MGMMVFHISAGRDYCHLQAFTCLRRPDLLPSATSSTQRCLESPPSPVLAILLVARVKIRRRPGIRARSIPPTSNAQGLEAIGLKA